jgi:hypothetical protein
VLCKPAQPNGCLVLDVVNRGRPIALRMLGKQWLLSRGYTVAMCGWQDDLPHTPDVIGARLPEALDTEGRPLTGLVRSVQQPDGASMRLPLGDAFSSVAHVGYRPADLADPHARLIERNYPWGPWRELPREAWRFTPDGHAIESGTAFVAGKLYEVIYTAQGAVVTGAGMAANRDLAAYLRNHSGGQIQHVVAVGASQTGRFLRQLVYLGMCTDEQGQTAIDGVLAHIAGARQTEVNWRFGQSSYNGPDSMSSQFPYSDVVRVDTVTQRSDGLLARATASGNVPKIMHVNSSAEYWGPQNAALIHTTPDGSADVEIPQDVRIYHFAGTDHFGQGLPLRNAPGGHYSNSIDYTPLLRAAFSNLHRWIADASPPPPSRYPRLGDGTLVSFERVASVFAKLPGPDVPPHRNPLRRLDFGPLSAPGIVTQLPPGEGPFYPQLVPAVDADGNEISGIRHPDVTVPLATYTGWLPRPAEISGSDMPLPAVGATIPFSRQVVADRYRSREAFVDQVHAAAEDLASGGYLLAEDVASVVASSATRFDQFTRRHDQ